MTDYKDIIIKKENELRANIERCNIMYNISNRTNYSNYKYDVPNKEELADFIYDNYDYLNDEDIKYYVTKCLSNEDMRRILLEFELENKEFEQSTDNITSEQFIKEAIKILNRYQSKGGGYRLEDSTWKLVINSPSDIDFINTIDISFIEDESLNIFIDTIVERLDRLSINYKVDSSYKEDPIMKVAVITIKALAYE